MFNRPKTVLEFYIKVYTYTTLPMAIASLLVHELVYLTVAGVVAIIVCKILQYNHKRIVNNIMENRHQIKAEIIDIRRHSSLNWNGTNPYYFIYRYVDFNGITHKAKSHFIWKKPNVNIGDVIEIYVDKKGNAALVKGVIENDK